jgi:hypothetical protein
MEQESSSTGTESKKKKKKKATKAAKKSASAGQLDLSSGIQEFQIEVERSSSTTTTTTTTSTTSKKKKTTSTKQHKKRNSTGGLDMPLTELLGFEEESFVVEPTKKNMTSTRLKKCNSTGRLDVSLTEDLEFTNVRKSRRKKAKAKKRASTGQLDVPADDLDFFESTLHAKYKRTTPRRRASSSGLPEQMPSTDPFEDANDDEQSTSTTLNDSTLHAKYQRTTPSRRASSSSLYDAQSTSTTLNDSTLHAKYERTTPGRRASSGSLHITSIDCFDDTDDHNDEATNKYSTGNDMSYGSFAADTVADAYSIALTGSSTSVGSTTFYIQDDDSAHASYTTTLKDKRMKDCNTKPRSCSSLNLEPEQQDIRPNKPVKQRSKAKLLEFDDGKDYKEDVRPKPAKQCSKAKLVADKPKPVKQRSKSKLLDFDDGDKGQRPKPVKQRSKSKLMVIDDKEQQGRPKPVKQRSKSKLLEIDDNEERPKPVKQRSKSKLMDFEDETSKALLQLQQLQKQKQQQQRQQEEDEQLQQQQQEHKRPSLKSFGVQSPTSSLSQPPVRPKSCPRDMLSKSQHVSSSRSPATGKPSTSKGPGRRGLGPRHRSCPRDILKFSIAALPTIAEFKAVNFTLEPEWRKVRRSRSSGDLSVGSASSRGSQQQGRRGRRKHQSLVDRDIERYRANFTASRSGSMESLTCSETSSCGSSVCSTPSPTHQKRRVTINKKDRIDRFQLLTVGCEQPSSYSSKVSSVGTSSGSAAPTPAKGGVMMCPRIPMRAASPVGNSQVGTATSSIDVIKIPPLCCPQLPQRAISPGVTLENDDNDDKEEDEDNNTNSLSKAALGFVNSPPLCC